MCGGSAPSQPAPQAAPEAPRLPEAPQAPTSGRAGGQADRDARRRRVAQGTGTSSTILSGPRGVQQSQAVLGKDTLGG